MKKMMKDEFDERLDTATQMAALISKLPLTIQKDKVLYRLRIGKGVAEYSNCHSGILIGFNGSTLLESTRILKNWITDNYFKQKNLSI